MKSSTERSIATFAFYFYLTQREKSNPKHLSL